MSKPLTLGLALFAAALAVAAGRAAPPDLDEDCVQDVLYVGQPHPLLIRLKLKVEDKSAFAHYDACMARYFAFLDRNDDKALSKNEASRVPTAQQMTQFLAGNPFVQAIGRGPLASVPFADLDEDRDGKVTYDEFAGFYARNGAGPLTMTSQANFDFGGGFNPYQTEQPVANSDAIFALLDTDKDGRLSRREIEAAERTLSKFDADDNEMVSKQEIGVGQQGRRVRVVDQPLTPQPRQAVPSNLVLIPRDDSGRQKAARNAIVRDLIGRYDKDKDGSLGRDEIAFPKALFDAVDRNKDGKLTLLELSRWASEKPAGEFTVRLRDQAGVKLGGERMVPAPRADDLHVTYGGIRINVVPQLGVAFGRGIDARVLDVFDGIDQKKTGFVTRKQLEETEGGQAGFLKGLFDLGDRNADGRFARAELKTLLDTMNGMRGAQLSVGMAATGSGLFQALDANGDGQLSPREMRRAWERLSKMDADGDGYVGRDEFPQQYQLTVSQGNSNFLAARGGMEGPVVRPRGRGPVWFTKMDRNGDGDVSRNEWLGEAESFEAIDTDKDGLLSLDEAEAYDARARVKG